MLRRLWLVFGAALLYALLISSPATASRHSSSSYHYQHSRHSSYTHHSTYHSPRSYTSSRSHSYRSYHPRISKKSSVSHTSGYTRSSHSKSTYCKSCSRDSHGHIKRSEEAREAFKHSHPCPSTGKSSGPCPGYVIDHVQALKHGGADEPSNMQWQTKEAAAEKDKWE